MKSQKDAGGLFALVTMEKPDDVNFCISRLNQTVFRGNRISVMKVCGLCCSFSVWVIVSSVFSACTLFVGLRKRHPACKNFKTLWDNVTEVNVHGWGTAYSTRWPMGAVVMKSLAFSYVNKTHLMPFPVKKSETGTHLF